jgi:hypothetical protein
MLLFLNVAESLNAIFNPASNPLIEDSMRITSSQLLKNKYDPARKPDVNELRIRAIR